VVEKKMNKKYNYALIVGGLTFLGILLATFLVVRPLYLSAGKLTKEAGSKQANLDKLKDKKTKLEELKSKEAELKADSDTVAAALPEGKDAGRLFIQFDELVKSSAGQVKSVSEGSNATTTQAIGSVNAVSYTVPVTMPDYFSLKNLIAKSESALRLINIDTLNIKSSNGAIDATLNVVTFTRQ
jgi:hypothetical protein